jgi:hypothetical protein
MFKLGIPPDDTSYTVVEGPQVEAIMLEGGGPRTRAAQIGSVSTVTVSWTLNPRQFDYIKAFYRTGVKQGVDPFEIDLIGLENATEFRTYTAWFVPQSFTLSGQEGLIYIVSASLWVVPSLIDSGSDLELIGGFS